MHGTDIKALAVNQMVTWPMS